MSNKKRLRRPVYSGPRAIIIDNGTSTIVAGWAAADAPRTVFPTIIGVPKHKGVMVGMAVKSHYTGDEAFSKRGILKLSYPIKKGVINSFDDMERIWHHTFYNELRIDPSDEESPFLMTLTPFHSKLDREKMAQIMFETFMVNKFYIEYPSKLALLSSGRKTGIVLQSGGGITYCVPVLDGKCLVNAIEKVDIGGENINLYLNKLLTERGYQFITHSEKEIVRDIKEKLCYVAEDYKKEMKKAQTTTELRKHYELPSGQITTVNSERFGCTEALFKPHLIIGPNVGNVNIDTMDKLTCLVDGYLRSFKKNVHIDAVNILYKYIKPDGLDDGIHQLIYRSIMKCDVKIRNDLFSNIVLCGGNTMFPGFADRLTKELQTLVTSSAIKVKVKVVAPPERKYSVWIGGSILTTSTIKKNNVNWITREEYDQYGPTIVHTKCAI